MCSSSDEVIGYGAPAWRDSRDVFENPEKVHDTLLLRNRGPKSRFVVVYDVCQGKSSRVLSVRCEDGKEELKLEIALGKNGTYVIELPGRDVATDKLTGDPKWNVSLDRRGKRRSERLY